MLPIPRSQAVYFSMPAGATGAFFPFPDVPLLNSADTWILGVSAYSSGQVTSAPNGAAVIGAADTLGVAVTLNQGSDERHKLVPYTDYIAQLNSGSWKEFVPFKIDWQKSGANRTGVVNTGGYLYFVFYYCFTSDDLVTAQ